MTENREQSQTTEVDEYAWAMEPNVLVGSDLGPFRLVVTADFTLGEDGYADIPSNEAHLTVTNQETGETLIDKDVYPIFPSSGFNSFDQNDWYGQANIAIEATGYDIEAHHGDTNA